MRSNDFARRVLLVIDVCTYLVLLVGGMLLIVKDWDFVLRHIEFLSIAVLLGMGIAVYLFWCYQNAREKFIGVHVFLFTLLASIVLAEVFFHYYPRMIPVSVRPCVDYHIVAPLQAELIRKQEIVVDGMFGTHRPLVDIEYPIVAEAIEDRGGRDDIQSAAALVRMDEMGFRNSNGVHSGGEPDVVVLGDSYAHGLGVRQNWSELLVKELGLRVVNLAGIGGAPQHWLDALRYARIDDKGTKVILVTFWDNNDFGDAIRYDDVKKTGGNFADYWAGLGFRGAYKIQNPLHRWLASNSVISGMVKAARNVSFERSDGAKVYKIMLDDGRVVVRTRFRRGVPEIRSDEMGWILTERALEDVKDIADKVDARVVLLYFSVNSNLYYKYIVERDEYIETNWKNYGVIRDMLKEFCENHGVGFIDVTKELEEDAGRYPILQTHHYTEIGHEFIERAVERYIAENRLLNGEFEGRSITHSGDVLQ